MAYGYDGSMVPQQMPQSLAGLMRQWGGASRSPYYGLDPSIIPQQPGPGPIAQLPQQSQMQQMPQSLAGMAQWGRGTQSPGDSFGGIIGAANSMIRRGQVPAGWMQQYRLNQQAAQGFQPAMPQGPAPGDAAGAQWFGSPFWRW
jgi:hypothetical protein